MYYNWAWALEHYEKELLRPVEVTGEYSFLQSWMWLGSLELLRVECQVGSDVHSFATLLAHKGVGVGDWPVGLCCGHCQITVCSSTSLPAVWNVAQRNWSDC